MNVLIIGGGVIGLAAARELRIAGAGRITVLEKGRAGMESSWAAAGMLAPDAETETVDAMYRLCRLSNEMYPEFAAALLDETGIDIELDRTGTICAAFSDDEADQLRERLSAQQNAGMQADFLSAEDVRKLEPSLSGDIVAGALCRDNGQVENRKLVQGLSEFARRNAIEVLEHSPVDELIIKNGETFGARSNGRIFEADAVVIAVGAWSSVLLQNRCPQVTPVKGQVIAYKNFSSLWHVVYGAGGYLVPRRDGRLLVGATVEDAGFNTDVTADGVLSLRSSAERLLPELAGREPVDKWAGLRPFAAGGEPLIGAVPGVRGLFVATGHYRNGILLAPVTAKLIAEAVLAGSVPDFARPFLPASGKEAAAS
ncbi:MAG: glycine oxidase ThiO [Acidobacteria bacterium]|nr:glycine oxidase ThiO [Acidobacteriota bacterium]